MVQNPLHGVERPRYSGGMVRGSDGIHYMELKELFNPCLRTRLQLRNPLHGVESYFWVAPHYLVVCHLNPLHGVERTGSSASALIFMTIAESITWS